VMYQGKIVGIVSPDTPREHLGLMMAGGQRPSAAPEPSHLEEGSR